MVIFKSQSQYGLFIYHIRYGSITLKRITIAIITVFFIFAHSIFAQTQADYSKANVSIKFYDRTMYYPGNSEENPVYIHITIRNNSTQTLRFMLADDRMFSLDFRAFNVKNAQLPQTEGLLRKRTTNQMVYFREISLQPDEEYSFIENLKNYLTIEEPSIYYVELSFYPELYKNKSIEIKSNRLSLEVHPSPSASSSTYLPLESSTGSVLQREEISPDKVVEQTIIARQRSLWDQFFLYMDLEQMLKNDPARGRKYNLASADERAQMLRQYRADLSQSRIDTNIVAIPSNFHIETTTYSQTEGTVTVIEYFNYSTYLEKKRYTYYVRQRDGIWQIYDYTVDNIGTE